MNYEQKRKHYDRLYMDIAYRFSKMSHCERRKVGAVIVSGDNIISHGWNGMPAGMDNCCEIGDKTNPLVIHAEANAITKLAKSNESALGATLYVTTWPCIECAKLIITAGITRVVWSEKYRCDSGLKALEGKVLVERLNA